MTFKKLLLAATFTGSLVLLGAVPANAATQVPVQATPSADASHCWQELDTGNSACAQTESALTAIVLDRFNVVIKNAGAPLSISQSSASVAANNSLTKAMVVQPRATWVLGTVYADRNAAGYSQTQTGSAQPCLAGGGGWLYNFYFLQAMNDNIESVQAVAPCKIKVYADIDRGGSSTAWLQNSNDIGGMRNVGSSIEYHR